MVLLSGKQLQAKEVGQASMIPQSRTYDVLESLTAKGLAMATPSSPKLYTAMPFEQTLPSFYSTQKVAIQTQMARANEQAQQKLDELTENYKGLMEGLKDAGRHVPRVTEPVWVIEGRDNIERAISSLIQASTKELMRITRPPELQGNQPFDPFYILRMENSRLLEDAGKRGVRIRWLSLTRELPSYLGLDVEEPPERRYLERDEDILEKFFLADEDGVLLNLYDPRSSAFGSAAMLMHSQAASAVFREHFEAMWEKGKQLDDVLPGIRKSVDETCSKMKELGYARSDVVLYQTLAKVGACSKDYLMQGLQRKKVGSSEASKALSHLIRDGIVHENTALRIVMVEGPSGVQSRLKDRGHF